MINNKLDTRRRSILTVEKLGLPTNNNLPLLEDCVSVQSKDRVVSRSLCIYALLAVTYGLNIDQCKSWLAKENLLEELTDEENELLKNNLSWSKYQQEVEALWALAWCLDLINKIDYLDFCGNNLSSLFPKISKNESTHAFRSFVELRSYNIIWNEADLIYCIHWGMVEASLNKEQEIPLYVIEERRRAVDWILFGESWLEVSLDT